MELDAAQRKMNEPGTVVRQRAAARTCAAVRRWWWCAAAERNRQERADPKRGAVRVQERATVRVNARERENERARRTNNVVVQVWCELNQN